ncbi:MAG: flippase-like domain-containing protein, partial [Acidobacteria bacterium]|nr:flippase-like domain-containing protein [Acidobacteriota bacterium]
ASQGVQAPFPYLVSSYLVASFFNNLLPTNIGGDVFRIKDAARYTASKTLSTAVVFVDRLLGFAALFALALLALAFGGQLAGSLPGLAWLWIGVPALTLVVLTVLIVPEVVALLLTPLRRLGSAWATERVGVVTEAFFRFRRQLPALAQAFAVSVLIQGSLVLFHFLVASAMRIPLPLTYCFLVVPLCLLAQLLPSINGFGVRESVFVVFFRPIGLGPEQAVSLSFVATGMVLLLSMVGGAIYAGRKA